MVDIFWHHEKMVGSSDDSFCRGDNGECRGRRDGSGYEPRAELEASNEFTL